MISKPGGLALLLISVGWGGPRAAVLSVRRLSGVPPSPVFCMRPSARRQLPLLLRRPPAHSGRLRTRRAACVSARLASATYSQGAIKTGSCSAVVPCATVDMHHRSAPLPAQNALFAARAPVGRRRAATSRGGHMKACVVRTRRKTASAGRSQAAIGRRNYRPARDSPAL